MTPENTKSTSTVTTSVEEGVGLLTLRHPPLNILTHAVLDEFGEALVHLAAHAQLRVLLLRAEGKHFSAGADVGEHLPPVYRELIPAFMRTVRALYDFPQPVVVAVQGRCLGGGFELVQAADMVVASADATFGQPEIQLGVTPPAACALLPELCPRGIAAEVVFTGKAISAGRAREAGLVTQVVPPEELETASLELANRIARHSAVALRLAKRSLRSDGAERTAAAMRRSEVIYLEALMETEDANEGLRAFVEKRSPEWKHQ